MSQKTTTTNTTCHTPFKKFVISKEIPPVEKFSPDKDDNEYKEEEVEDKKTIIKEGGIKEVEGLAALVHQNNHNNQNPPHYYTKTPLKEEKKESAAPASLIPAVASPAASSSSIIINNQQLEIKKDDDEEVTLSAEEMSSSENGGESGGNSSNNNGQQSGGSHHSSASTSNHPITVLPSFCEIVPAEEKYHQIDDVGHVQLNNGFPTESYHPPPQAARLIGPSHSPLALTTPLVGGHYPPVALFNYAAALPFPFTVTGLHSAATLGFARDNVLGNYISNKRKYEPEFSNQTSNKRGKKHDSTPVEEYVNMAIKLNNYDNSGLVYITSKFIIIHEDKFYQWVSSIKPPEYALSKSSLFEKFDKSRRTNRVNPRENSGKIPIKFLRIDKLSRNGLQINNIQQIEKDLEEIQKIYGTNHIRVITHRDWGYIDPIYFVYEVPAKKT